MRQLLTTAILLILLSQTAKSQINYFGRVEGAFLKYSSRAIRVDAGPDWKGYNLDEEQNGVALNIINGISFLKQGVFIGIGLGYLNFEGIKGLSVFADFEYLPLKTRLSPLINIQAGYSHIWNQYENGTGAGLGELCFGLNYRLSEKIDFYTKSGFSMTQQSLLVPVKLGIRF